MSRVPVWLLPAVLAVADLAVWPGVPLLRGEQVSPTAAAATTAITVVAATALLWRRRRPVVAAVVVLVALAAGAVGLPENAQLIAPIADLVALFSVAVRRPLRTTLMLVGGSTAGQAVVWGLREGVDAGYAGEMALIAALYAVVVAAGRGRARWHDDRAAAAARLAEAEQRRARAADTERHRLARELHDVSAHHLTSIVVSVSAAQRLVDKRPELAGEALEFAARTGRETLEALRSLVAILQSPGPQTAPELDDLVRDFRSLGQPVTLQAPEAPGPATAGAAHGIIREALTNTLRYAPGAPVEITLTRGEGSVLLTVDNEPGTPRSSVAPASTPAASTAATAPADVRLLGGGRGVTGMRERAAELGGHLEAGPREDGGWRVRAVLPDRPAGATAARRSRAALVIDAALVVSALAGPAVTLTSLLADPGLPAPGQVALVVLGALAHAAPLMWRRHRPWLVLALVLATGWTWPVLIAAGLLPTGAGWLVFAGCVADLAAVYAVARFGRRPGVDWLAMPAGLASLAATTGAVTAMQPPPPGEESPGAAVLMVLMTGLAGLLFLLPVTVTWLAGHWVHARRRGVHQREETAVAVSTFWAHNSAWAERARVAAGLRAAVLRHTEDMTSAATAGDLDGVLVSARSALDAMRGLLSGLRADGRSTDARDPQPTLAAAGALIARWRQHGRDLDAEMAGADRPLPADVDLSAYRVVELLLAAGTGPARLRADATGDPVRIVIAPPPDDPDGEIGAGLRARAAAVGGVVLPGPGTLEVHLPAPLTSAIPPGAQSKGAPGAGAQDSGTTGVRA